MSLNFQWFIFLPDNSHIDRAESPPSEILNDRSPTYFAETDVGWSNGISSKKSTEDVDEKSRQKRIEEEDRLAVPSPPPEDDEVKKMIIKLCYS